MAFAARPSRSLSYGEIALRSNQGNLIGRGAFSTRGGLDLETGQGIGSVHWHQGAIGCEVEVDIETGKIKVLRLSPVRLRRAGSSILGCANCNWRAPRFLASGQALFEEMAYDDHGQVIEPKSGRLQHSFLRRYSMGTKFVGYGTSRFAKKSTASVRLCCRR